MDVTIAALLIATGASIAIQLYDLASRAGIRKRMAEAEHKYLETVRQLNETHNELAKKLLEMHDKVAAHDYQLTARMGPTNVKRPQHQA